MKIPGSFHGLDADYLLESKLTSEMNLMDIASRGTLAWYCECREDACDSMLPQGKSSIKPAGNI